MAAALIAACTPNASPPVATTGDQGVTEATVEDSRIPVIVDTDVDSDDAMALLYLLKSPKVKVLGVSVSGDGFMTQAAGVPTALSLVALGGKPDTPVSYGTYSPNVPLEGFPDAWRQGAVDFYSHAGMPAPGAPPDWRSSPRLIVDLVKSSPRKVTILGLAPNTNIADAFTLDPTIRANVERVVLSAGAFDVAGNLVNQPYTAEVQLENTASYKALAAAVNANNKTSTAEYNVALDAPATSDVVQSGVPVLFSPLNASQQAPVDQSFLERLKAGPQNDVVKFVIGDVGPLLGQNTPVYMWDPVAAAQIVNPALCTATSFSGVAVNVTDSADFGTTTFNPTGKTAAVCESLDANGFFDEFAKTIQS